MLQQVSLMLSHQGFYHRSQVALDDFIELVQGEVDSMIRNASLWKVVGPNALRSVARANQLAPIGRLFVLLFGHCRI
jgi:hypothetical protein